MSIFDYASQSQPEPQPIPPEQLEETTLVEPVYVTIVRNIYTRLHMQLKCCRILFIIFRILLDYLPVFPYLQI